MSAPTPPSRIHRYAATVEWTGDEGVGTRDYRSYRRDHVVRVAGKPDLLGSSDLSFRGDRTRHNPDELLVVSLSACHMLWYLHLAASAGIVVRAYEDRAEGTMVIDPDGGGRFTEAVLRPRVRIEAGDPARARALHDEAHRKCFVANSVNFPVRHEPTIEGPGPP
jgi:organic hydroperoxide reductase OsmC/OhrA